MWKQLKQQYRRLNNSLKNFGKGESLNCAEEQKMKKYATPIIEISYLKPEERLATDNPGLVSGDETWIWGGED